VILQVLSKQSKERVFQFLQKLLSNWGFLESRPKVLRAFFKKPKTNYKLFCRDVRQSIIYSNHTALESNFGFIGISDALS